jgi:hypothetical protein
MVMLTGEAGEEAACLGMKTLAMLTTARRRTTARVREWMEIWVGIWKPMVGGGAGVVVYGVQEVVVEGSEGWNVGNGGRFELEMMGEIQGYKDRKSVLRRHSMS